MNQITQQTVDQTIEALKDLFGFSASKVELYNDLPKSCIYSINTKYSIGKTTMVNLKAIKGKIVFIGFDNDGLRLLVEIQPVMEAMEN